MGWPGALGDGSSTKRSKPTNVAGSWRRADVGDVHFLGIRTDGTLWAWGGNPLGQLGDGTTTARALPRRISTSSWSQIEAERFASIAVRSDASLWAWGEAPWTLEDG